MNEKITIRLLEFQIVMRKGGIYYNCFNNIIFIKSAYIFDMVTFNENFQANVYMLNITMS